MKSLSGSATINAAFAFIPTGWRGAWGALGLYIVPLSLLQGVGASMASVFASAGQQQPSLFHTLGLGVVLTTPILALLALAGSMASYGALMRLGLDFNDPGSRASEDLGPAGLQWRGAEWRIVGACILMGLCFIPLVLIGLGLMMGPILALGRHAADPAKLLPVMGLSFLLLLLAGPLMVWVTTRLFPFLAATVDQKRIVLFGVWPLTRRHFWAIFLPNLAIAILGAVLALVVQMLAAGIQPILMSATGSLLISVLPVAALQSLAVAVVLPAKIGAMTYVYRTLKPAIGVAEVFN